MASSLSMLPFHKTNDLETAYNIESNENTSDNININNNCLIITIKQIYVKLTLISTTEMRKRHEGSKRHSLQAVELSQRTQAAVQIVSNLPTPSNVGPIYRFFGHAGHADPLDGWRCCSQKRVMSRPIQVRQL